MKISSTLENIITLVTLAFPNKIVTPNEVAEYLGVSRRQAQNILNIMISLGYAKKVTRGKYYISSQPKKAISIIKGVLKLLHMIVERLEGGQ